MSDYVYVGKQTPAHRSVALSGSFVSLGAFTRNGYTAPYYADEGSLRFDDRNIKNLYEAIRNFDIDLQRNTFSFSRWLDENKVYDTISFLTGNKVKKSDLRRALILRSPTWALAVALEIFSGKRPLDEGFKALMTRAQREMADARSFLAVLTGLAGAATVISAFIPGADAIITPFCAWLTGIAGVLTTFTFVLEPIFGTLSTGKPPSKEEFFNAVKGAASLAGQEPPSDATLNTMYSGMTQTLAASDALKSPEQREREERLKQAAIAEAKAQANAELEERMKAIITKASLDAAVGKYDPPKPVPPPDFDRQRYDATWNKQKSISEAKLKAKAEMEAKAKAFKAKVDADVKADKFDPPADEFEANLYKQAWVAAGKTLPNASATFASSASSAPSKFPVVPALAVVGVVAFLAMRKK